MGLSDLPERTRIRIHTAKFLALAGVILFGGAGTVGFGEGWLYLGLQLAIGVVTNMYLVRKDPALLRRRLKLEEGGEVESVQRRLMGLSRLLGAGMLLCAALDRRFAWSHVPLAIVAASSLVLLLGAGIVLLVFGANTYTSSIIEVEAEQRVIASGPYRFARHPMYAGVLLSAAATPLVLGSIWTELFLAPSCALLVGRILAEEEFLSQRLQGYTAYAKQTPSRLIPGIW